MESPEPVAEVAGSAPAADFSSYAQGADAADVARATSPDRPADLTSAQPADQAAATAATPGAVSETAIPSEKGAKLKARHAELDTEIESLKEKARLAKSIREELATIRQPEPAKPQGSQPAPEPTKAEWERYMARPDAPKEDDFAEYPQFVAAMGVFAAKQFHEDMARSQRLEAESRQRVSDADQTITTFNTRVGEAIKADPDFVKGVAPGLMEIVPRFALRADEQVGPANVLMEAIVQSEAPAALLRHFSTDEGRQDWQNLAASPNPAQLLRKFGRLEARFLSDGSTAGGEKPAPVKTVTSAPDPPTVLGNRPPLSADREKSAVGAGDYSAYEAAANARDLSGRSR